jgi:hypothetical protein
MFLFWGGGGLHLLSIVQFHQSKIILYKVPSFRQSYPHMQVAALVLWCGSAWQLADTNGQYPIFSPLHGISQ